MTLSDVVFGSRDKRRRPSCSSRKHISVNQRQGTQSTLTRTEVSGGGRKPWRAEGYRPCKTGFHKISSVDTRWCSAWSEAPSLQDKAQQEGSPYRNDLRSFLKGSKRRYDRSRYDRNLLNTRHKIMVKMLSAVRRKEEVSRSSC